ncbi:hypothetical protein X732_30625 [Mesorhizobium sp. L2C066B000]|nr:hypothetical protein X732_30625 [Mesorhizobium sp. L2C066B000]
MGVEIGASSTAAAPTLPVAPLATTRWPALTSDRIETATKTALNTVAPAAAST